MRLICTITQEGSKEEALVFSSYLSYIGIENSCEPFPEGEWPVRYRIWVKNEDDVPRALKEYENYKLSPEAKLYQQAFETESSKTVNVTLEEEVQGKAPPRRRLFSPSPYGFLSTCIIGLCIFIFFWAQTERGVIIPPKIEGVIQAPVLAPIEQKLIFEYPQYFVKRDELLKVYTPEQISEGAPPSRSAQRLIQELKQTPVWMGGYDLVVHYFKTGHLITNEKADLFESIEKGEVWRLFTPALLHFDLLHIFFNLMWFILLGNQIEHRLGLFRYGILILLLGILPNVAQYLMSGPFFMGLSGIVCGLAAFIWARQQVAPWEGYLLQKFTLIFLSIFVLGLLALQVTFFFFQIFDYFQTAIGIANTAHITGAITGYILGRMRRVFKIREIA
jgi:GlpG protein